MKSANSLTLAMNDSLHCLSAHFSVIHCSLKYSAHRNEPAMDMSIAIATGRAISLGIVNTRGCHGNLLPHTRSLCFWYRPSLTKSTNGRRIKLKPTAKTRGRSKNARCSRNQHMQHAAIQDTPSRTTMLSRCSGVRTWGASKAGAPEE